MRIRPPDLKSISGFLSILFPFNCNICGQESTSSNFQPFCEQCWSGIRKYEGVGCRTCGTVTAYDPTGICQECRSIRPTFDRLIAFGIYEGGLKEVIHCMKFGKIKRLARMLGKELGQLDLPEADCIIPVPLSVHGLRRREFNQSAVLAKELSRINNIPLDLFGLNKSRETALQSSMSRTERIQNVKGAFSPGSGVAGKRVMLVDDVVTTAATVNECSRVLMNAGAVSVIVVAAARAKHN